MRRRTVIEGFIGLALASCALAACGRRRAAPGAPAEGGGAAARGPAVGEGRVASAPDGGRVVLDTGREVKLAGLLAPLPASGDASAEPLFADARAALADLALGARARLVTPAGRPESDRWGRAVARLSLPEKDGLDVNRELVARGFARVRPEEEEDAEARALLALEAAARDARRGIWASRYYAVRDADTVTLASQGAFAIVEGVVVDADAVRGWIYLNFGPDYRTDFTAGAPPEASDGFDEDAMLALPGARVRVRGEIERYNGPFIKLYAPAQVERLG